MIFNLFLTSQELSDMFVRVRDQWSESAFKSSVCQRATGRELTNPSPVVELSIGILGVGFVLKKRSIDVQSARSNLYRVG